MSHAARVEQWRLSPVLTFVKMLAVLLLLIAGQALPQLARADAAPTVGEKWPYHGVIFGA